MERNDNDFLKTQEDNVEAGYPISQTTILWGLAAIIFSIIGVTFNNSAMVLGAGFFAKFFAVIVGSILGLVGALAGDVVRKFAHPDSVFTSGGFFHLIWIKLFWMFGPQVIGLVIGVVLGCSIVLG